MERHKLFSSSPERRNDMGYKVTSSVIAILLGLFFTVSWSTANSGKDMAQENKVKLREVETCLKENVLSMKEDIHEIKTVLQRRFP